MGGYAPAGWGSREDYPEVRSRQREKIMTKLHLPAYFETPRLILRRLEVEDEPMVLSLLRDTKTDQVPLQRLFPNVFLVRDKLRKSYLQWQEESEWHLLILSKEVANEPLGIMSISLNFKPLPQHTSFPSESSLYLSWMMMDTQRDMNYVIEAIRKLLQLVKNSKNIQRAYAILLSKDIVNQRIAQDVGMAINTLIDQPYLVPYNGHRVRASIYEMQID